MSNAGSTARPIGYDPGSDCALRPGSYPVGGQYVGNAYKALLHGANAQLSHSRRGECYDNAQAESLWSRLKTEVLEARDWPVFSDLADAQASVAAYFDYYSHDRRHSSIGYQKPYQFHQQQLNNITQFSPA